MLILVGLFTFPTSVACVEAGEQADEGKEAAGRTLLHPHPDLLLHLVPLLLLD